MLSIGLDVGGTKTEAIVMDESGVILSTQRRNTVKTDYRAFVTELTNLIQDIQATLPQPASVGICLPGTEDSETHLFKNSNIVVLNQQPLIADIERILGYPIAWDNDANCFTLSEATDGAGQGAHAVFGAILGTGCGGGLTVNKQLLRGRNGNAGEWGHNPLPQFTPEYDGAPVECYCGQMNCTESFISGTGIARQFNVGKSQQIDAKAIFELIHAGDEQSMRLFIRFQDQLARSLASVVNVFDPDVIVIGGGLSRIPEIYHELPEKVARYIFNTSFTTPIVPARYGDSSGVRGAAWLGREQYHLRK